MKQIDYCRTPTELENQGREFFAKNPQLLSFFRSAAKVLSDRGMDVSARQLIEFVRMTRHYGIDTMHELVNAAAACPVFSIGTPRIPNNASAYLTRYLAGFGFKVSKARSKLDQVKQQ